MSPHLVNEREALATGQLPDKEGQMYHANTDNFYLIPTGEVPSTNIYRDVIIPSEDFSIKLTDILHVLEEKLSSMEKM